MAAACTGGTGTASTASSAATGDYAPYVYEPADPAPTIDLIDQDGRPFQLDELRGSTVLISFGYSHCPDVCPTTLAIDRDVLLARPDQTAVVFVTIDPARDTPTALGAYLKYFGAPMIGVSGSEEQIAATAKAWGVAYAKEPGGTDASYAMAHTAGTFVVDPAGRLRYLYPYGTPAEVLTAAVDTLTAE